VTTTLQRFGLFCFALGTPLLPSLITLEPLTPAGLSVIPRPIVLGLAIFFGLLAVLVGPSVLLRLRSPLGGSMAVMMAWWSIAGALGYDPAGSLFILALIGSVMLGHLVCVQAFREGSGERYFLRPALLGACLSCAAALLMAWTHRPAALFALAHGRAVGTFLHPGELAGYTLMLAPVAFGAARYALMPSTRVLGWIAGALAVAALALSFSRAAWAAAIVGVAFAAFATGHGKVRIVATGVVLAGALAFWFVGERHHNPDEDYTRLAAWRAGIRAVEASPLLGSGGATFWRLYPALRPPDGYPDLVHAHDVLLAVATESGLVGLGAFVALWWRFAALVRGGLVRCGERAHGMVLAIATGLVATWVQGAVDLVTVVFVALWFPFMGAALGLLEER